MLDLVKDILTKNNLKFIEIALRHGTQLVCTNGAKVNVFNNNSVQVQGKAHIVSQIKSLLGLEV